MYSIDLEEIIDEFEKTSYYNVVSKPNNFLYTKLIIDATTITILFTPIEIYILNKFGWYSIGNMLILSALTFLILLLPAFILTSNKLIKSYIFEYNTKYGDSSTKPFKDFNKIRLNEFYKILFKKYQYIFSDNFFSIFVSYIETKEKQLSKDPENTNKMIALIGILAGLFASIVGGIIPLIVQKLDIKYLLLVIFVVISIIWLIYSIILQILNYQTKDKKLKKSLKELKFFLYQSKLRYDLELEKEKSYITTNDFNNSNENSSHNVNNSGDTKIFIKSKLHKLIDILFE